MLYSASTGGFYIDGVHPSIPSDAVAISAETHAALLEGQSIGQRIVADNAGNPVLAAPPPLTVTDLKIYTADKRWRVETGGIVRMGLTIPTDDRAKLLLLGASSGMADEATAPYNVGTTSVTLTGAQFKSLYAAVFSHVQNCMARQCEIMAEIDAGTITTVDQIETAVWPA